MCFASGIDEAKRCAKRLPFLKQAETTEPTGRDAETVTLCRARRKRRPRKIDEDERALMARALDENSVIIAQMTPFFD